eukprot:g82331.t1
MGGRHDCKQHTSLQVIDGRMSVLLRVLYWLVVVRLCGALYRRPWAKRFKYLLMLFSWSTFGFVLAHAFTAPHGRSAIRKLLGLPARPYLMHGKVNKGFEPVQRAFERNYREGLERASQLVIYHKGKRVVDIFGSCGKTVGPYDHALHREYMSHPWWVRLKEWAYEVKLLARPQQRGYDSTSLQPSFACAKNIAAMAVAVAVDRGWLKYDDPISKHWPAFAPPDMPQKAKLTLAELLRHQAGLQCFAERLSEEELLEQMGFPSDGKGTSADMLLTSACKSDPASQPNAEPNRVAQKIQNSAQRFPDPSLRTPRAYHGTSSELILTELLRRVDPKHRTLGQLVTDEIAAPLGIAKDCLVGFPKHSIHRRLASVELFPDTYTLLQTIARLLLGSLKLAPALRDSEIRRLNAAIGKDPDLMDWLLKVYDPGARQADSSLNWLAEIGSPSFTGIVNARALAKLGSCWLNGGVPLEDDEDPDCGGAPCSGPVTPRASFESLPGLGGGDSSPVRRRRRLLSANTIRMAEAEPEARYDAGLQVNTSFTQGGFNVFQGADWDPATHGFIGWGGYGGSMLVWHPQLQVVLAYTQCGLGNPLISIVGFTDERCLRITRALRQVLRVLISRVDQVGACASLPAPPSAKDTVRYYYLCNQRLSSYVCIILLDGGSYAWSVGGNPERDARGKTCEPGSNK